MLRCCSSGDIDRGGVFAQLYGTVDAFGAGGERRVSAALSSTNSAGDKTILDPGVEMLEKLTGIPVVGVAPYLQLSLDDEDSLSERLDGDQQVGSDRHRSHPGTAYFKLYRFQCV